LAEETKVKEIAQKKTIQKILANDYLSEIEKRQKSKAERVRKNFNFFKGKNGKRVRKAKIE